MEGGELVQSTLYMYMALSQRNPLVLLIYDKSKNFLMKDHENSFSLVVCGKKPL
jgi:hypothetical protein